MALINEEDLEITAEKISKDGLEALDEKYQKSIGFFAWDFFVAIGKLLKKIWDKIIYIAGCFTDLNNMDYNDLVNFVYLTRGIKAKTSTASSGYLTITNGSGSIREGDIFETSSGLQFKATSSTFVKLGGSFHVECLTKGSAGNVPAGSICVIPTTIQGVVSVKNVEDFTNGYDDETKEDLIERYYLDLQLPATSGNKYHYQKWALEVTGVGAAKVKPLWNGKNTVKVVIIDSNKNKAPDELIDQVQQYIDPYKLSYDGEKVGWGCGDGEAPIGAYCTVTTAEELILNFAFKVKIASGFVFADVCEDIKTRLNDYIKSIAFEETYISYAKLGALIVTTDGVLDYSDFYINDLSNNIELLDNNTTTQIAVTGTFSIGEME